MKGKARDVDDGRVPELVAHHATGPAMGMVLGKVLIVLEAAEDVGQSPGGHLRMSWLAKIPSFPPHRVKNHQESSDVESDHLQRPNHPQTNEQNPARNGCHHLVNTVRRRLIHSNSYRMTTKRCPVGADGRLREIGEDVPCRDLVNQKTRELKKATTKLTLLQVLVANLGPQEDC